MNKAKQVFLNFLVLAAITNVFAANPNKLNAAPSEAVARSFYQSIADYYRTSQKEVKIVREANIQDEEIPVVYFIVKTANASLEDVLNMRSCGMRWMDIAKYFDLSAKVFSDCTAQIENNCRKHEAAVSESRHKRKKGYYKKLNDKKIIEAVNIKFISEDNLCSPAYVKKLRKQGSDFVSINHQLVQEHRSYLEELKSRNRAVAN